MKKDEKNCHDCQHFTGIDGVGEMWISCNLHGDFKVQQRNCSDFKKKVTKLDLLREIRQLREENEQLRQTMQKVCELLEEEVDLFSDEATEHDVIAYSEMQDFDNKDAYYICTATKKAIQMLKGRDNDE